MPIYSAYPPFRHVLPAGLRIFLVRICGPRPVARRNIAGHQLLPGIACRNIAGHRSIGESWPGYCGRVPDTGWTEVVALGAAYLIAVVTTPAGISGAVLLLPFQISVLATPSPAVTPTNLLYNVIATPG